MRLFEPWSSTEPTTEKNLKGWASHEAHWARMLKDITFPTVIEIGSFYGKTAHMLLTARTGLRLYCIDPWRDYSELRKYDMELAYKTWEANLWEFRDRCDRLRMTGVQGLVKLAPLLLGSAAPHVIYIDGAHDEAHCYADIAVASACFPGAKLCGDDVNLPGVRKAVELFASENNRSVIGHGKFWEYLLI